MAKKSQGYQTPNEKYNAEFGEENAAAKVKQSAQNKVQDNFQTPDEKYNAEFGVENTGQTSQGKASKYKK
ncbi:hypothetical protein BK131_02095 [Paenibacillus amylolyticus]|uniref:Uncharacterized protein n=1 Tax=Paenibacillus amylolyticus TaxID=1451 RepID=A0A1R1C3V5_PAEAM|nr:MULTISPECIES: hypothetical protein [Paenibacillus]MCW3792618.1 hypothetical protein [Paenibacillus sp. LS1]OMF16805.1 hypothetical protein BK131_02095 [Paenibacillus amylolyticus]